MMNIGASAGMTKTMARSRREIMTNIKTPVNQNEAECPRLEVLHDFETEGPLL